MRLADEKGVALIMVLILMGVLSVLGASLIFVSQTETWASQNYRLMSEARYGAESGVHKATNFLLYNYTAPGVSELGSYVTTTSPITSGGSAVQLGSSGASNCSSNYPTSSVISAFASGAHGTLTGGYVVTYDACAKLIAMRQVTVYGSTIPVTIQTWKVVGTGSIAGPKPARVDVEAIIERQATSAFSYAAFATDAGCGALSWSGGGSTDSYDSSAALVGGVPVISTSDGNVGTNGNLDENGGPTVIHGSLSTPRTGVGTCATGAVTALTLSGSSAPSSGLTELPQSIVYQTPDLPNPMPPTGNVNINSNTTRNPGQYGDLRVTAGATLTLNPGTYNINSISLAGNAKLLIAAGGPVILNVAGVSQATPVDLVGGSVSNATSSFDPSLFQIIYAGSGTIKMAGGSKTSALVFAPNATVQNNSTNADWYGAVIAKRVTDSGHATLHYDRRLGGSFMMVGPWMMSSFSWGRF